MEIMQSPFQLYKTGRACDFIFFPVTVLISKYTQEEKQIYFKENRSRGKKGR